MTRQDQSDMLAHASETPAYQACAANHEVFESQKQALLAAGRRNPA